jgi:3-hydroxyisobutyrate dehydrogenase-like beta-hydroxyacid dehydrogenase
MAKIGLVGLGLVGTATAERLLAEELVFASKLGLEPQAFLELLKVTPAYSAVMDVKGKKMLDGDFTPQARLAQHHKDVEAGDGGLDNSAVIREIERGGKR